MRVAPSRFWLPGLSLSLAFSLATAASAVAAPESPAALGRLNQALVKEQADALRVVWTQGSSGAGSYRRLRIESGKAALERCEASCQPVGAGLTLSGGERAQLISRLRGAELGTLRDSEQDAPDRQLEVAVAGTAIGAWKVSRAEWPSPPDGYGVADFLDDLSKRIEKGASARPAVAVPSSPAELQGVRLQLRVQPRSRAGGLVVVEAGRLRVTPEEGSLPRSPRPRPFERALTTEEQGQLVAGLQAARLDELDGLVPKRGQPAIGDEDGRLATLHLMPADSGTTTTGQPRGYERYLADLSRSPAGGLLGQLLGFLVTESAQRASQTAAAPRSPSGRGGDPPARAAGR